MPEIMPEITLTQSPAHVRHGSNIGQPLTRRDGVLKVTGADPSIVQERDSEILTTKIELVDISKSVRDLDHKNSYSLEEGMQITADWMRRVYNVS